VRSGRLETDARQAFELSRKALDFDYGADAATKTVHKPKDASANLPGRRRRRRIAPPGEELID
jgi:hypothetical protein